MYPAPVESQDELCLWQELYARFFGDADKKGNRKRALEAMHNAWNKEAFEQSRKMMRGEPHKNIRQKTESHLKKHLESTIATTTAANSMDGTAAKKMYQDLRGSRVPLHSAEKPEAKVMPSCTPNVLTRIPALPVAPHIGGMVLASGNPATPFRFLPKNHELQIRWGGYF